MSSPPATAASARHRAAGFIERHGLTLAGIGFSLFLLQVLISILGLPPLYWLPPYALQAIVLMVLAMAATRLGPTRIARLTGIALTTLIAAAIFGLVLTTLHRGGCYDAGRQLPYASDVQVPESWDQSAIMSWTWTGDIRCELYLDSGEMSYEMTWWEYLTVLGD
ncbi:hypothetical protein [Parenemella sanctibonifatiensis]|uniref:Uncharacterized protein n=1 Tax=Parenemella sanctibonifatiensis TaxID=2016505 RepID=A0A255EL78_9ACTN|nr:hypothetical protein [Parenemella sanctibonifatiensis]OYN92244.1 hypothetical protein CGZ91_01665 [Parenemella sanctibonifatiensis]